MANLIFTVGLPRSGKSTFAKRMCKSEYDPITLVSADDIRLELYGHRFFPGGEGMVHATKDLMIRSLLRSGNRVLDDCTNTSRASLLSIFRIDKDAEAIIFMADPNVCKERAFLCDQCDLVEHGVIDRMYQQMLELGNGEYSLKAIKNGIEKIRETI